MRTQFLDLVTGELLARNKGEGAQAGKTVCLLCGGSPDNWAHMLLSCRHEDVRECYTARHNVAGKKLVSGLRDGTLGRWLIQANFGKVDGNPEDTTVPGWLLGEEGGNRILAREKGDRGIKPDMLILERWPENASLPTGPEKWRVGVPGAQRRKVTVHIAEA
eukprot:1188053-Prorocentrum_minimum.AAC.2